ncbi:flagellar basal body-associated FliL family protein [Rhodobacteraceae bacterium MCCB 386]|nr:flagellar basal body-associated FliL family protein [Roseitranquillus sediminis]
MRPEAEAAAPVHGDAVDGEEHGAQEVGAAREHAPAVDAHSTGGEAHAASPYDYVKLNNQFVVPILRDTRVTSLVVLSIDLEVESGQSETVYRYEPKLRDSFLTVLFDHANAGGFDGAFTSSGAMTILRNALNESGHKVLGDIIHDVLITNIVRQDV